MFSIKADCQEYFPYELGSKAQYSVSIEMPKGYVSGIGIIHNDSTDVKCSIFNEFGVSVLDFQYLPNKKKVKLCHVIGILDRWYIKRIIKKDLYNVISNLKKGITSYQNNRYQLKYLFRPLEQNTNEYEIAE